MKRDQAVEAERTFSRSLSQFQGLSGYYALIRGDRLVGLFPTREAAEVAWMVICGPVPMYLRQITPAEATPADASDAEANGEAKPRPRATERAARRPSRPYRIARQRPGMPARYVAVLEESYRLRSEARLLIEATSLIAGQTVGLVAMHRDAVAESSHRRRALAQVLSGR